MKARASEPTDAPARGRPLLGLALGLLATACATQPVPRAEYDAAVLAGHAGCAGQPAGTPIDFVYVHGAARNKVPDEQIFAAQIETLHYYVLKEFNRNPEILRGLLDNCRFSISPDARPYYWGQSSQAEIEVVDRNLAWSNENKTGLVKKIQPRLAYAMHDTAWLSRLHNEKSVLLGLQEHLRASFEAGRPVVLWGHSAGALAVLSYMRFGIPYVDQELIGRYPSLAALSELLDFSGVQQTCVLALLESDVATLDDTGQIYPMLGNFRMADPDAQARLQADYLRGQAGTFAAHTQRDCAPPHAVLGIVTVGSPALVFSSKGGVDAEALMGREALSHLFVDGRFWIDINHHDDLVGFPLDDRDWPERLKSSLGREVRSDNGFFISNYRVRSGATMLSAHSWYIRSPAQFARVWSETYSEGYQRTAAAAAEVPD